MAQAADAPSAPTVADVQHLIEARGPGSGALVTELLWGSRFQVHHKLADRFVDGPYARAQRSAAEHVLAMTRRLTRVATVQSAAGSRLRNWAIASASRLPPVRRKLARTLAGVA